MYLDLDRRPTSSANHKDNGEAADAALSPEELKKQKQKRRKVRGGAGQHYLCSVFPVQRWYCLQLLRW